MAPLVMVEGRRGRGGGSGRRGWRRPGGSRRRGKGSGGGSGRRGKVSGGSSGVGRKWRI